MYYLKGNAETIIKEIKNLWINPPKNWEKYECKDERFIGRYIWFKYIGSDYPLCYIYVPNTVFSNDKVQFRILPKCNDDEGTLLNREEDIIHSFFDAILSDEIKLIFEE